MFKKICLIMVIILLFSASFFLKLKSSNSQELSEGSSSVKWDIDRAARLPDSNFAEENLSIIKDDGFSEVIQPEPAASEKIDFTQLDNLDSSLYAWWILLNKNHEPTTIPSYAKKLIEKYGGVYQGDTTKKEVYLTFDEGYENGYTPGILDTLKANNVKALFFVTGAYVKTEGDLVKRMLSEGHLVGNHSINHLSLPKLSDEKLENELYGLEKNFTAITGKGMKYMRPPCGEYSEKVLSAASQLGYKTIFWSFAFKDFDLSDQKGWDFAYKKVIDNLHNGAIILLHAISKDNAEALDRIIKEIKAEGYIIKPFDL